MKKLIVLLLLLSPVSVFAQQITNFDDVTYKATNIGQTVIVILISFAVIWIIVNVVRYLIAGKDGAERAEGGMRILWGVVGLFVILSIWGLVAILKNTFSTNNNVPTNQFPVLVAPPGIGGTGTQSPSQLNPGHSFDDADYFNSGY